MVIPRRRHEGRPVGASPPEERNRFPDPPRGAGEGGKGLRGRLGPVGVSCASPGRDAAEPRMDDGITFIMGEGSGTVKDFGAYATSAMS